MTSPRTSLERTRERASASHSAPTNQPSPRISHHLADLSLTPLLSTSTSASNSTHHALTTLTTTAVSAHTAASRLGLGAPLRLMVETKNKGPVVLHSFLDPKGDDAEKAHEAGTVDASRYLDIGRLPDVQTQGMEPAVPIPGYSEEGDKGKGNGEEALVNAMGELQLLASRETRGSVGKEEKDTSPPMLVGTVVVDGYGHMREARRAASKLEAIGKSVQEEWRKEREGDGEVKVEGEEGG